MSQQNKTIQVGALDPELKNSPIREEMDDDEVVVLEAEDQSVCYYNGASYAAGQYVCSGSTELLQCNKGVWVQVGTCDPENQ